MHTFFPRNCNSIGESTTPAHLGNYELKIQNHHIPIITIRNLAIKIQSIFKLSEISRNMKKKKKKKNPIILKINIRKERI